MRLSVGLTAKVFTATALVVVAVLAGAAVIADRAAQAAAQRERWGQAAAVDTVLRLVLDAERTHLAAAAAAFARAHPIGSPATDAESTVVIGLPELARATLGADFAFLADSTGVSLARTAGAEDAGGLMAGPLLSEPLAGRQGFVDATRPDSQRYLVVGTPLRDGATDSVRGVLVVGARDRLSGRARAALRPQAVQPQRPVAAPALGALAAGGLLLALAAAVVVGRAVTRPVGALTDVVRRAADGDETASVSVAAHDEVGRLAGAVQHLLDERRATLQLVAFLHPPPGAGGRPSLVPDTDAAAPTMVRASPGSAGMLAVGQRFAGRYEIKAILGVGGLGVVYRAWDSERGLPVAIRALHADVVASEPTVLQRVQDEMRLVQLVAHRNVVRTYDTGAVEGLQFIAMEYVEGRSLQQLVRERGRLPVGIVVTLGKQLCRALAAAHAQGVLHRALTPQNIIMHPSGTLKVMDFGISRLASRTDGVTEAGVAIGTPEYMAPEQLLGAEVGPGVDIYAAGCVLFECLAGRPPFVADSPITLVAKQLEEAPPALRMLNADVPEALERVVLAALDKDPDKRPVSAGALHDLLDAAAS